MPKERIGWHLAALRERAGLKQRELAKKLKWSAGFLSRIESGERPVSDQELHSLLKAIGTPDATKVKRLINRNWKILHEPTLADPDGDLLWEAEQTLQKVHAASNRTDLRTFFLRRLDRLKEEIVVAARGVMEKRYRAVFIGSIAVGKSTAICRLEGLELASDKGMPKALLETGAGGISVCEVHIHYGPGYGLIVEPCPIDEIRHHISDFSNFLKNSPQTALASESEDDSSSPGVSREVERALRNMAGLQRKRTQKRQDGTVVPGVDDARVLASTVPDAWSLSIEILGRMELHKRDRRDIWFSHSFDQTPFDWLQEMFERVNSGQHPDFALPRRIELVVPTTVLGDTPLAVTLIDTPGIDQNVARPDIEHHFDDAHTLVVLCMGFNEALSSVVRQLLARAKEGGVRILETNAAILILPRPGEALAVRDNGVPIQDERDGCEIRSEEVSLRLHSVGLGSLPIAFFNAVEDSRDILKGFVCGRVAAICDSHRAKLREIISCANALLLDGDTEHSREVMAEAAGALMAWIDNNIEIVWTPPIHVQESLLRTICSARPRTIYASIVRHGEWPSLDYAHELGHGARRVAVQAAMPKLEGFRQIATVFLDDERYCDAHDLIHQALRAMEADFDKMILKARIVGQSIYTEEMRGDAEFWQRLSKEWGRGSGYRERINALNAAWFLEGNHDRVIEHVTELVREAWGQIVMSIRLLLTLD